MSSFDKEFSDFSKLLVGVKMDLATMTDIAKLDGLEGANVDLTSLGEKIDELYAARGGAKFNVEVCENVVWKFIGSSGLDANSKEGAVGLALIMIKFCLSYGKDDDGDVRFNKEYKVKFSLGGTTYDLNMKDFLEVETQLNGGMNKYKPFVSRIEQDVPAEVVPFLITPKRFEAIMIKTIMMAFKGVKMLTPLSKAMKIDPAKKELEAVAYGQVGGMRLQRKIPAASLAVELVRCNKQFLDVYNQTQMGRADAGQKGLQIIYLYVDVDGKDDGMKNGIILRYRNRSELVRQMNVHRNALSRSCSKGEMARTLEQAMMMAKTIVSDYLVAKQIVTDDPWTRMPSSSQRREEPKAKEADAGLGMGFSMR